MLVQSKTLKVLLWELGVAINQRNETRTQLDSLQRMLGMGQYKPRFEETLPWLG